MAELLNVLVMGGQGYFGRRLMERLSRIDGLRVFVAGRRAAPDGAANYCQIDARADGVARSLRALDIGLLAATIGPFYPGDYRLARAAIEAGAHYLDLSDCREHVTGISALDAEARRAGVLVTSGASSVPALSSAVIDALRCRFSSVRRVEYGITASELTPGIGAVKSALRYCGKPIVSDASQSGRTFGWQDGLWKRFDAPLGRRWLLRCDIPDLDLFPDRYGMPELEFRAGVAGMPQMLGLWELSWLVRSGLIRSAVPLAAALRGLSRRLETFGSGRSGMYVRLEGTDADEQPLTWEWQLIAQNNHGPYVPVLAAAALARRFLRGWKSHTGAMPCMGLLGLADFAVEFVGLDLRCTEKKSAG